MTAIRPPVRGCVAMALWIAAQTAIRAPAQEPTLAAQSAEAGRSPFSLFVQSREIELGQPFEVLLVTVEANLGPDSVASVQFEADAESWHVAEPWSAVPSPFELEGVGGPGAAPRALWRAKLQPFETGEVDLPGVRIVFRGSDGSTEEMTAATGRLEILSARREGDQASELLGPKPLYGFARDWKTIALSLLAGLAAAIAAFVFWRRFATRRVAPTPMPEAEPRLPPGLWALAEIARRRELEVCRRGPAKEIVSLASEVVRIYLGRRYELAVLEKTTFECMNALERRSIEREAEILMREFLDECDLIKFSKFELAKERWSALWEDAERIVRLTTSDSELSPRSEPAARELAGAARS